MENIFNTRACLRPEEMQNYLDNTLSDDQRFDIENHLLDCSLCEAALEGFSTIDPQKAKNHLEEIKAALPSIAQGDVQTEDQKPSATVRKLPRWRNWAAAAAAIALLLLSTVLYRQLGPQTPDQLFAAAYEPYESPFAGARASLDPKTPLAKGLAAYQEGEFAQAIPLFESAMSEDGQYISHFHAGLASLQIGDLQKAEEMLDLTRYNSGALYGPACWYRALALLKANRIEDARNVLLQIRSDDKEYYPQAQDLLGQLQRAEE